MATANLRLNSSAFPTTDNVGSQRGPSGVWADFSDLYTVRLEAFGQTEAEIEQAIARYLDVFPADSYHTRFDRARENDGEFVAMGSRNALEGWF
ncbi:MAG: hypothetical protein JOY77_11975 [Alphaproteobacteria bacterium]|nr:hypothetical protein [Alphaproteobacteria bacterium]MBV9063628.1 hypothetical protein [Alphaproteobacteria bacterium]